MCLHKLLFSAKETVAQTLVMLPKSCKDAGTKKKGHHRRADKFVDMTDVSRSPFRRNLREGISDDKSRWKIRVSFTHGGSGTVTTNDYCELKEH